MKEGKTSLGYEREDEIRLLLEPIIRKYAKELNTEPRYIKSSISYLWEVESREEDERWQNYLSANEIGPYGGR